jgi:hypothetical protein
MALAVIGATALIIAGLILATQLFGPANVAERSQTTVMSDSYPDAGLRHSISAPAAESYLDAGLRSGTGAASGSASGASGFECLLRNKIDDC